jgi:thiamine biosynthesis lipoprotein
MKKALSVLLIAASILSGAILSSCTAVSSKHEPYSKQYLDLFNTVSVIYSYADESESAFEENCTVVYNILLEYHRLFDIYYEYTGINNLATVNRMAGRGPVEVDGKIIDFLLYCKDVYAFTGEKTNIALGSVLSLWHKSRSEADDSGNSTLPDPNLLFDASHHTSIDSLIINKDLGTVEITDENLSLDVGAIAKGYAVEKAKEFLVSMGITSYVLNIGGNISAIGTKPSGDGWKTAIKNPADPSRYSLYVELSNESCVTSGNYERYFVSSGKKYHHIIDPKTLYPAEYFGSVTVITEDSGLADALSTALFCMSYEEGLALISSIDGVEAVWIYENGEIKTTSGIKVLS